MDGFSRDKESTTTGICIYKTYTGWCKRQTARATGGNYPIGLTDFRFCTGLLLITSPIYFPMQNFEKMFSNKSSVLTWPVIEPR